MKTVLSVKDFALLYELVLRDIHRAESFNRYGWHLTDEEIKAKEQIHKEELKNNHHYQDLLRLREALGNLQVEVETPNIKIVAKENADD